MNIFGIIGAVIATTAIGSYRAWKTHRNSLDDDVRAEIFWNDRRYEALEDGITWFFWGLAALAICTGLWVLGLWQEWWCYPYCQL